MDKKTFWEYFKRPKGKVLIWLYIITLLCIAGAVGILFTNYLGTPLEIVAYALFALAALSLGYSVYTIVLYFPKIKTACQAKMRSYPLIAKLLDDFSMRTLVFAFGSLIISILYSLYNGVIAIIYSSGWYGSLAMYYIFLVLLRGGIGLYHGKHRNKERSEIVELKKYRTCGILLIATIWALLAAIIQMVVQNKGFAYLDLLIYVAAAYTFTKITLGILNVFKARKKQSGYTVQALRNVSLADAAVSLLTLQTAMFHAFAQPSTMTQLANALTGSAVCLTVMAVGIYMIIKANKELKTLYAKERE